MSRIVGSRIVWATFRAVLVVLLVSLPQLIVGNGHHGPSPLVILVALLAGLFVLSEYRSEAPSLLEFREARPYNRLLVIGVTSSILAGCALLRSDWSAAAASRPLHWLGAGWERFLDLPWSPVHHLVQTLPVDVDEGLVRVIYAMAATAYMLSLLTVALFAVATRLRRWPRSGTFNIWVNLPQFDPSGGGDVVERLQQNALVNLCLGFLLPLIVPIFAEVLRVGFHGSELHDPAAEIWVVVLWAFLPAALVMRGLALHRLAQLIAVRRLRLRRDGALPLPA